MTSRNEYKDTLEVQFSPPESDRSNLIITINNEQIVAPLLKKFSPFAHIYDFLQSVRKGKETKLQIPGGNSMFTIDAEAGSKKLKITAASNQNNKKLQIYGTYYRTDVINIFARACMFALENGFAEWEREKLDFEPFVYEVDEEVEDAE